MSTATKTLDKSVVKEVAEDLMDKNGQTTTLDVKTELRKQRYFATQDEISKLMFEIGNEEDWDIQNSANMQHRIYSNFGSSSNSSSLHTVQGAAGSGSSSSSSTSQKKTRRKLVAPTNVTKGDRTYTRRDGQLVEAHDSIANLPRGAKYWKVTSSGISAVPTLYFDGQYPRDMVKGAFRGLNNVHWHKIRASKM